MWVILIYISLYQEFGWLKNYIHKCKSQKIIIQLQIWLGIALFFGLEHFNCIALIKILLFFTNNW